MWATIFCANDNKFFITNVIWVLGGVVYNRKTSSHKFLLTAIGVYPPIE
ncbi:hypothetical protein GCM10007887_43530 [Methylobacterium haplocladii]|nr:hypothetical protein GCM10007887_43530 [Methylobacterium haplocladii]